MFIPRNKLKILLVDDSEEFLSAVRRYLDTQFWAEVVGHAHNGTDAIARTAEFKPDLVLMDIAMPGMNGIEATRRIRSLPDASHVIMLSLHDTAEYRRAAHEAGAEGFVTKSQFLHKFLESVPPMCGRDQTEDGRI